MKFSSLGFITSNPGNTERVLPAEGFRHPSVIAGVPANPLPLPSLRARPAIPYPHPSLQALVNYSQNLFTMLPLATM